jgi:hypothetical protein
MLFFAHILFVMACCVPLLSVSRVYGVESSGVIDPRLELEQIDASIKTLEDERDRFLAAAAREEDKGMRWQFMQDQKQEAKRAFQRADAKREAAGQVQTQIDALNARRVELLKDHPDLIDVIKKPS